MINSLFKDSHITQSLSHPQIANINGGSANKRQGCSVTVNKQGIIASKPAEISFSGLSSSTLANSPNLKTLVEKTRSFLAEKNVHKEVRAIIKDSVDFLVDAKNSASESVKNFLNLNKSTLETVMEESKVLINSNEKKVIKAEDFNKELKETINKAVDAYPAVEKQNKIYTSKFVKNFAKLASENQMVFSAAFSTFLACLLRPATIMALPGKKNQDDKKYASSHSISSGVIGFLVSLVVGIPVQLATKKIELNPEKYITKNLAAFGEKSAETGLVGKQFKCASKIINLGANSIIAVPQAIITVALIPPVLKYIFKMHKPASKNGTQPSLNYIDYSTLNFKSAECTNKQAFQSFKGGVR